MIFSNSSMDAFADSVLERRGYGVSVPNKGHETVNDNKSVLSPEFGTSAKNAVRTTVAMFQDFTAAGKVMDFAQSGLTAQHSLN